MADALTSSPRGSVARGADRRKGTSSSRRGGFTLAETALAMIILLVALLAMSAATLRMHTLRRQNRERSIAQNAVRTTVDRVQAISHEALERDPNTWSQVVVAALSAGGEVGTQFNLAELTPTTVNGQVGSIQVVVDETLTDAQLGMDMGMPRDLNADGVIDNTNVTASARVLPLIIQIQWIGVSGTVTMRHPAYLLGY